MKKTTFKNDQSSPFDRDIKSNQRHISDLDTHLTSVADACDMLDFLRSSTNTFAAHEEVHTPEFYRGLSQCLGAVQEKLVQGLSDKKEH